MASSVLPWLDQAGELPVSHIGGIPHFNEAVDLKSPRTGVLHTTEGGWAGSLAIFKRHFAPHFMLGFDADAQKVRIAQLVQVGTIGAALKAHNALAVVQVEMVAFSKEQPWLPDKETVIALASLMAACNYHYGIPLTRPWPDGDFGKAGKNPHRASGNFGKLAGWYGHGDCPSPDIHHRWLAQRLWLRTDMVARLSSEPAKFMGKDFFCAWARGYSMRTSEY